MPRRYLTSHGFDGETQYRDLLGFLSNLNFETLEGTTSDWSWQWPINKIAGGYAMGTWECHQRLGTSTRIGPRAQWHGEVSWIGGAICIPLHIMMYWWCLQYWPISCVKWADAEKAKLRFSFYWYIWVICYLDLWAAWPVAPLKWPTCSLHEKWCTDFMLDNAWKVLVMFFFVCLFCVVVLKFVRRILHEQLQRNFEAGRQKVTLSVITRVNSCL